MGTPRASYFKLSIDLSPQTEEKRVHVSCSIC